MDPTIRQASRETGRILVVDDDPRNIGVVKEILEDFTVLAVRSGQEALEKLRGFAPDIILLDIMMPDMDGYEVCRRIRGTDCSRFTKIIFVSGKAYLDDRLTGYEAGADDYLIKPFDGDELLAKVRVFSRLKSVEEILQIKSDFLALINHETRTPLTGLLALSELLLQETEAHGAELQALVRGVHASARRLMGLLEKTTLLCTVKTMSAVQAHPCPVAALAEPAVAPALERALEKGVQVAVELSSHTLVCDAGLLSTALGYVVDNAVKFSPPGSAVRVAGSLDPRDGSYRIEVSDRGKGIDPAWSERIFGELSVGDVRHHTEGQGLSLAIARRILALHRGSIGVSSEEGKGAVFVLRIPPLEPAPPEGSGDPIGSAPGPRAAPA
ncbi:MAG: response regulator [Planctomycetes bacterium]|nr:response regulator [Planctomycetota bacterium]